MRSKNIIIIIIIIIQRRPCIPKVWDSILSQVANYPEGLLVFLSTFRRVTR